MKKLYMIALLAACMLGLSAQAQSVPRPKTFTGMPDHLGQYVLVSAYNTNNYSHRTGWDGAVYFGNDAEYEFTAESQTDGTWTFYVVKGEDKYYMHMPDGTGNLNSSDHESQNIRTEPAYWHIEAGDFDGFVKLKPGEGNSEASQPYFLHLNAGGEYFVISEPVNGGGWYPDYAGGALENPDPDGYEEYLSDETGRYILKDHTSENWAFIAKSDFPLFQLVNNAYKALVELEASADNFTEYATGFNATLNAALAQYYEGYIYETEAQTIIDMINAKNDLFNLLLEANDYDADAALKNAIAVAQSAFDNQTATDVVNQAVEDLRTAIADFNKGTGDFTSLIINPSFEDLSSQGGVETRGIQGAPKGWNVFINGTQVTTAAEVQAAGIQNWHGINSDCDGDKDGMYGFGIWTAGVPEYEISQTVEGLDCGTYTVTASVMVGSNGNGSRRTTQRIFGNFNTAYFGHQYDYDESLLETSEVRSYADLDELYTDRTLQRMSVRAYVYDGKLTFGLRTDGNYKAALRETGNGSGGDGWFKLDDFHIQKEGYIASEAAEVANTLLAMFKNYQDRYMYNGLTSKIQTLAGKYSNVTAETPQADINAMILALNEEMPLIADVQSSIAAYEKLLNAIDDGYVKLDDYAFNKGADEYEEMLETAFAGYQNGDYTDEQIEALIDALDAKLDEVIKAGVATGTYVNVIKNPSFEDLTNQDTPGGVSKTPPVGWTLKLNGTVVTASSEYAATGANLNWCSINGGDAINAIDELGNEWTTQYTDGTHLFGIWAANMPEVELSQTIEGLPAGTYILSCDMVVPNDWSGYSVTTQRIFANHYIQMFSNAGHYSELNETEDMKIARGKDGYAPESTVKCMNYAGWQSNEATDYNDNATDVGSTLCPYPMSLTFGVGEDGIAYIGFRTNNIAADGTVNKRTADGWFKLDNFKLYYESTDIPTAITSTEVSGKGAQIVSRQYFTADGREVAQPQRGITIVKNTMSDGSVKAAKIINK